ncbi:MAG: SRPBCC family protein [Solirubrobacteraceae bacterium]
MATVVAQRTISGTVAGAERIWCDTSGWARWVDGLDRVLEVSGAWPQPGGVVRWESGPAGRGQVAETVVQRRAGECIALDVRDDSIDGRQTVAFTPAPDGVHVTLELSYRIRRRSPVTPLIDRLFVRRAMEQSLERTLARFGAQQR